METANQLKLLNISKLFKSKKVLLIVAGLLVIAAAVIVLLSRQTQSDQEDVIWREYTTTYGSLTASLDGGGTLESTGIHHSFGVDLKIKQIFVEVGQEIKAGNVLVNYDKDDLLEQIEDLERSLNGARRALEDAQNRKEENCLQNSLSQNESEQSAASAYESQKREIENTIEGYERSISQLQERITQLEQSLNDIQNPSTSNTQGTGISSYESRKREIENSIQLLERKIMQMQNKLNQLSQDLRTAQASQNGSTESTALQRLLNELDSLKIDLSRLENSQTTLSNDRQLSSLKQQRSDLYDQLETINRQITAINDTANCLVQKQQELAYAQERLLLVQQQIAALADDDPNRSVLEVQRDTLQDAIRTLENEIAELSKEAGNLSQLLAQAQPLKQQISSLNGQISELEDAAYYAAAIQKKQAQIADVQAEIDDITGKELAIDSLNDQITQTSSELEAAIFDLDTQRIALSTLTGETVYDLDEQITQAKKELETAQYNLETQQIELTTLNSDYQRQTTQNRQNAAAQSQINALNSQTLDNAVENAQAEVERLRTAIAAANEMLKTPALIAKTDGIVTELRYSEGDTVPAGKSIVTIGSSGEKRVAIQVSQEDIIGIELGQVVEMQFLAIPNETICGHVAEKSLVPTTGGDGVNYRVSIEFDEPQTELMEGMTCSVKFILKRVENVLTLANKAITFKEGKQIVTVLLPDGGHEEREITTGFSDGRSSEIISGLTNGETVVVAG